jgi:hypothetical protein
VDAPLVRAFLEALPDTAPDPRAIARVRAALASLQDPDVRYLAATVLGPEAPAVARVMAAVLQAAGAPTATLCGLLSETTLSGAPLDDALFAAAGTLAASAVYQLHQTQPALGEVGRREASVLLGLIAFAEGGQRVALLLDEEIEPADPVHAPAPDLVVITRAPVGAVARAVELVPRGRPAVAAALDGDARAAVESWEKRSGSPLLLGGRDHDVRQEAGRLTFLVRGEPYVSFDQVPGIDATDLSCALAASLALGTLGIRMREEWLTAGLDALRAREHVAT